LKLRQIEKDGIKYNSDTVHSRFSPSKIDGLNSKPPGSIVPSLEVLYNHGEGFVVEEVEVRRADYIPLRPRTNPGFFSGITTRGIKRTDSYYDG